MAEPVDTDPVDSGRLKPTATVAKYWREITRYEKAAEEWEKLGDKIVKRYLDEDRGTATRRFAILWSNINTLQPAVYGKPPVIIVGRRYRDPDPKGRVASELLERATNTTFDLYAVDEVLKLVRDDRLLPGRGQAWVRYESKTEKAEDDKGAEYDRVAYEKVCVDYVHWKDFGHNVARVWADVFMVWRKVYKTRPEVTKRWGKAKAGQLSYTSKDPSDNEENQRANKACIYEVWDKKESECVWLAKDAKEELEVSDLPLKLTNCFPCPRPAYATLTSKSLFPTPDYKYYQDQVNEIDALTEKIDGLTKWLIVKGFIPAGVSSEGTAALQAMLTALQSNVENASGIFVPVESWAGFADKGGAGKIIDWLPIDQVIVTLKTAVETREQLIQDVYQTTGISDILRGQTDPNETLGAQELKAQTGSRRVKTTKDDMARFAKDLANLVAEVIADLFQPQTLEAMTGLKYIPPMPMAVNGMQPGALPMAPEGQPPQQQGPAQPTPRSFDDEVMALLRDDGLRNFRIDIETDSTIQPDEDAEKQRRIEFAEMLGGMLEKAAGIMQVAPQLGPMLAEGLKFVVRGFRAGREMEEIVEKTLEQFSQQPQGQQGPTPEQVSAEADLAMKMMDLDDKEAQRAHEERMRQLDVVEKQTDQQRAAEDHNRKMEEIAQQLHHAQTMRNQEVQRGQDQYAADRAKLEDDRERSDMERENMAMKSGYEREAHERSLQAGEVEHRRKMETGETEHRRKMEMSEAEHDQKAREAILKLRQAFAAEGKAIKDADKDDQKSKAGARLEQQITAALDALAKLHAAPRKVTIERGPDGKATGATSSM